MERIAILAALQWECRPVLRHMRRVTRERHASVVLWRGTTPGCEVWLVKTGMGIGRAAAAARAIHTTPGLNLIVSTGCAGALRPELMPGDLVVASAIISADHEHFETNAACRAQLRQAAQRAAVRFADGPVLCSPEVLATAAEKRAAAACGAIAVEMEGAPIAACAGQAGIPFVSVRAILDTAATALPHMRKVVDRRAGAVKPLALASYLATHPGALPALLSMQRMRQAAQISLDRFFGAWFEK